MSGAGSAGSRKDNGMGRREPVCTSSDLLEQGPPFPRASPALSLSQAVGGGRRCIGRSSQSHFALSHLLVPFDTHLRLGPTLGSERAPPPPGAS